MKTSVAMDARLNLLDRWLQDIRGVHYGTLVPLAGDASHRRYFRLSSEEKTWVVMDAPPDRETCKPFVAISHILRKLGLNAPEIFAEDLEQGFLIISDFGDRLFSRELNIHNADLIYRRALDELLTIQSYKIQKSYDLPIFDHTGYREWMMQFDEWYLVRWKQAAITSKERDELYRIYDLLFQDACAQPKVFVHRDYHSRNLMVLNNEHIGILDFQDAIVGPVTYDLVSLLRDCYLDWPEKQVTLWVEEFRKKSLKKGLLETDDMQQYHRWFDWIGLMRHLRCTGLFARLYLRDQKPGYLQEIPRVIRYIKNVCERYPEFEPLNQMLKKYALSE